MKEHQLISLKDPSSLEIYGSFFLKENEFAINVLHIQEVINQPEKYTHLPLAPIYLMGILNLRGTIIPVVDLRILLNIKSSDIKDNKDKKIAIVELNDTCIGLLFDQTGEIFRSHDDEKCKFNDPANESVIKGIFKKDEGKRLIQIVDIYVLFGLKQLPRELSLDETNRHRNFKRNSKPRKQCVSFLVGPARCGFEIKDIQEILKVEKISNTALSVGFCLGAINLRGATVPVIDFSMLLGYNEIKIFEEKNNENKKIIVLRLDAELFGILVESVESIVTYFEDDVKVLPMMNSFRKEMFTGCISVENKEDILLLNYKNILSNIEINEITHGHSLIYNASKTLMATKKNLTNGKKRTFVTFTVENPFAIPICEIKEIIDLPSKLLLPPGLPVHCKGVLNLRNELVTIIDTRELYKILEGRKTFFQPKVLIFKTNQSHFGLVVDSVDAIISIFDGNKVKLPELLYSSSSGMAEDIMEAIQCNDSDGKDYNLLVLNSQAIAERIAKVA